MRVKLGTIVDEDLGPFWVDPVVALDGGERIVICGVLESWKEGDRVKLTFENRGKVSSFEVIP